MKKQIIGFLLSAMSLSICVGCGAESTTTNQTEQVTAITTEESTLEQTEEITATSEVTEEPSEETTDETEIVEATIDPSVKLEPTEEPELKYTYTDMSATMYAQQTVNVRDLPDASGNKLGSLSTNDEIVISAKCNETGWYRIEYNGSVAYVSNKYVSESKVEIQQASTDNGGQASSGKKNWQDYYQDHVWYDMNTFMFIIVDSRDEGCNYTDYSGANATLEARFPGEKVYSGAGTGLRDGHWMFFSYRAGTLVDSFIEPFL